MLQNRKMERKTSLEDRTDAKKLTESHDKNLTSQSLTAKFLKIYI